MLEGVLGLRIQHLFIDELRALECIESAGQVPIAEIYNAQEYRLGELLADHRRRLQCPLLSLGEPIDPGSQHALHGCGDADLFCRLAKAVCTSRSHQGCSLDQRLDNLLDEEWIAARALPNQPGQAL